MRALALYLNGKKLATAGVGPDGVLAANVTWVGRSAVGRDRAGVVLGGLDSETYEHLEWSNRQLRVGDEVRIKVIETESVDRPLKRQPRNAAEDLRQRKQYVRQMAKTFGWTITVGRRTRSNKPLQPTKERRGG